MPNDAITPFTLAVPQADLEDLNRRIDQTRWDPRGAVTVKRKEESHD
jgi:hypothetical protein